MPERQSLTLTKRIVDRLAVNGKDAAKIIARLKDGLPPVETEPEPEPTVADLAERYEWEYVAMHCKNNTIKHYGLMLKKHIVPGLGSLRVSEVEKKHILRFQFGLSDMPTVANRTVDILVKMFAMAELWEMRPPGRNPCRSSLVCLVTSTQA